MNFFDTVKSSTNQLLGVIDGHRITLKREDLIHPMISGNKFRKLKYNFEKFLKQNRPTVLTFGGAFSNHLAATAQAGNLSGIQTIGIVRGEEWEQKIESSTTLDFCQKQGMQLYCISREDYRKKEQSNQVKKLQPKNENLVLLPEGGTNALAVKGCTEILTAEDKHFDTICCCVGTGGTLAGIAESTQEHQSVLGFNALNNPELKESIKSFSKRDNWSLISKYTFGGYAKFNIELILLMNHFYQQYQIPLDPIYTGKMLFGIFDLIKTKKWSWGENILVIHSGGLQGVKPMNLQLKKRKMPVLSYAEELHF